MINFDNGGRFVQHLSELPNFAGAREVFCDFETTSGNPKLESTNPHYHCSIAGIAITVDDCPNSYYVDFMRLPEAGKDYVQQWLGGILYGCESWVNHNVKYDAHVAANDLGLFPACNLVDTLTLSKIIDSDRMMRGGYGLDALSLGWLGQDIGKYEHALQPYLGKKNKDYGNIPPDILGEYACEDTLTNRRLWQYICAKCPEQCFGVWQTEIELTRNLFQMERNGLRVDLQELRTAELLLLNRLSEIDEQLTKIVGRSFRPHVNDDMFEVFCGQYGLPILAYTKDDNGEDTENPSFDKNALAMYAAHPATPKDVLSLVVEYRKLNQRNSLFISPWQEYAIYEPNLAIYLLRSTYNQCVRTGRMSASEPNAQQLDKFVKKLIHPKPGYAFISDDYSQIEFRFIGHYIQSPLIIDEYKKNPDADFHQMVADWCEIKRKPAKNVNFGVAFGEGKKKLIKQLAANLDLVDKIQEQVQAMVASGQINRSQENELFNSLATQRGEDVYNRYHRTFPTLKAVYKQAEQVCKQRGFVYNMFGRHRHLPFKAAYRAFNTLNQSSAADLMKERVNAVCRAIAGTPIELAAIVHDEIMLQAPLDIATDPRTVRDLVAIMETSSIENELRVPIRCAVGMSAKSWADAGTDPPKGAPAYTPETFCLDGGQRPLVYNKADAQNFSWL